MAIIEYRKKRTRQPQGVVKTRRSGLGAKLRAFYSPPLFADGNSIGTVTTGNGVAFDTQGSKSLLVRSTLPDSRFTVMAGIYVSDGADPDAAGENIYEAEYNGSNEPFSLRLTASRQIYTGSFSGGNVTHASSLTLGSYAVAYALAGAAGASEPWYAGHIVNGVDTKSTSTFTGASRTARPVRIGAFSNSGATSRYYSKPIVWVAEFDGHLTEDERRIVAENPWAALLEAQSIPIPVSAGGGAPTAALTGQAGTSASGSVAPSLSIATTGNAATTSAGTATAALSLATTGNTATASAGTATAAISLALTGNSATTSAGTVGVGGTTQALTGSEATTSAGTPVASISLALSGNAITTSAGTATAALALAITGNESTASAGTPVAAISLALTGNAATASAGTVEIPGVIVPTANEATAAAGTVSPGITIALTGNGATASAGSVSPAIDLALAGLAGTSAAGIVIPGLSLALSGNAATTSAGSISTGGDLVIALTGNGVTAYAGTIGVEGPYGSLQGTTNRIASARPARLQTSTRAPRLQSGRR